MIKNKKVLIVTTTDSMIGQFLMPHIKHLVDNGNIVECACHETGHWFGEIKEKGINIYEVPFARNPLKPTNLKAKKQLSNIVKTGKYNLIHCHTPVGGVMGRIMGKKYKIPVLYIAHGFHFYKGAPLVNRLVYKTIEKHYAKHTDALVTMNDEDYISAKQMKAKSVYKINGIGYDSAKHTEISEEDKEKLKKELNIKPTDFVILSVGELNKNKNQIAVIKAIKQLNDKNVKYFICGRGPLKDYLTNQIKSLGLEEQVKLLGFRKDVANILAITNLFVMPSIREGLPMSMMEAMDAKLPIVASNIRGCRDLVENNKNGLLVDLKEKDGFYNAIKQLKDNPQQCLEFGAENKEKIKMYYIKNVLNQMEEIYDNIFN